MDWKTFIAELVKALAWPGLIGVGLYTYHRAILNLLAALIRMLKRAQSLKYGDLVLATKSVNEAIDANEAKAESAAIALSQQNTTQDDRIKLAEELREATEESARLKVALENLKLNIEIPERNEFSAAVRHKAKFALMMQLLTSIGYTEILRLTSENDWAGLEALVNKVMYEARMPGNNTYGMTENEDKVNKATGLLNPDGNITMLGLQELHNRARMAHRRSFRTVSMQASQPPSPA